jgi:hypothetical protein
LCGLLLAAYALQACPIGALHRILPGEASWHRKEPRRRLIWIKECAPCAEYDAVVSPNSNTVSRIGQARDLRIRILGNKFDEQKCAPTSAMMLLQVNVDDKYPQLSDGKWILNIPDCRCVSCSNWSAD